MSPPSSSPQAGRPPRPAPPRAPQGNLGAQRRPLAPRTRAPARATPKTASRQPAGGFRERQVFYRWLWLVYVPWFLGILVIAVDVLGLLPRQGKPVLLGVLAWDAAGVGLFLLRRSRGVSVPVPRTAVTGLAWLAGLSVGGLILIVMGLDRMGSKDGPTFMVVGAFLGLVALLAPIFKLVDVAVRKVCRSLLGAQQGNRRPQRATAVRRRPAA
jgi:hypothetical protein